MTAAAAPVTPAVTRRTGIFVSVLALMVLICFIDSRWMAERFAHGQLVSNILMLAYFVWMYRDAGTRLRRLMKYGVVVATVGEVFFSLVVGMYEYRLENVPLYVPPGHSILYGAVYYMAREPWVLRHRDSMLRFMVAVAGSYAAYWWWAQNDMYGALCTAGFLLLMALNKDSRLFFAVMFLAVAYLEQVGTRFGCWYWHEILLSKVSAVPSGNPPSGIAIFYFGFDVTCLWALLVRDKRLHARWKRYREHLRGDGGPAPVRSPRPAAHSEPT